MVSYDFYDNVYMGSAISAAAFPAAIARAEAWLQMLERTCTVKAAGPDSRNLALCAIAEEMSRYHKRRQVAQETVGGVSVRYESAGSLDKALLSCAKVYLQVCRGVAQ